MTKLGLMADPGVPERIAQSIATDLSERLSARAATAEEASPATWEVRVSRYTLPLTEQGAVPLMRRADEIRQRQDWDYVVYLTDLPLWHDKDPMVCEVSPSAGAVLVSLPPLGIFRLRARTRALLLALAATINGAPFRGPDLLTRVRIASSDDNDRWYIVLPGPWNRARLLVGMVRSNRPGRLLPALSNAVAAAVASGAFGIFYASIWSMADALPPLRLAVIAVLAITVLSSWLIIRNGLWNRAKGDPKAHRDNVSTAITIALSVAMMYVLLHAALFASALVIIAGSYLESQLGHEVNVVDYAKLSWLAASLGTMAGAVGSNFDSDEAIREATYSRRQHERRRLAEARDDDDPPTR